MNLLLYFFLSFGITFLFNKEILFILFAFLLKWFPLTFLIKLLVYVFDGVLIISILLLLIWFKEFFEDKIILFLFKLFLLFGIFPLFVDEIFSSKNSFVVI